MSERKREGQTHRFFQPWKELQAANERLRVDLLTAQKDPNHAPRSSHDKALTAFAQLATLRLDVKRCMISLIDTNTQYILAEATQTVSLVDTGRHGKDDEVWLGSSSLDRHLAVCGCTFNSTYTVMDENGNAAKHNALVVEDMREDPRFRDREYVKNGSVLFYAGVPIRTRNGVRIGVYAVSNNEPRKPLNAMELSFMQDVAEAVMEHLELSKSKNDSIKGERVAKGLTSFIEGYSFYDEAAVETEMSVRSDFYEEGPRRPKSKQPDATATKKTEVNGLFNRAARIIRESTLASGVVFLDASSQFIPVGPIVENLESDASGTEHMNDTENSGGDAHEGRVSFRLSRPNKTLSLGGESNPDTDRKMSASDSDASPTRAATSDVLGIDVLANNLNLTSSTAHFPVSKKDLKTCIQRYPAGKVFSMFEDSTTSSGDDTTDASEAKSLSQSTRSRRRKSSLRRTMADEILRQLPGVQSVVFLPLWDSSGEKWLAGCFMWTTETGKLTDAEDELPFLKAFANSITSEYARIQAQFSERAKTTFIASISHELRSPLHGILGSIEFLHDTNIDSDQKSLVGNIEMAGKTLLDTINHVLDFAKINDFSTGKESAGAAKSSHARTTSGKDMSLNLVAEFDLSLLVEEVTEAIYAGRIFNRQRRADRVKNTGVRKIPSRIQSRTDGVGDEISTSDTEVVPSNVAIILNINKDENWNVRAQPGALRRVIMNVFGNACKYTNQGFVEVSLKSRKDGRQYSRLAVELKIVDSGKGMSDEYQKNQLFRAFSQEDPFQEGTGLGLSIVRQIVESLKGKIKIKSQQGLGTEVTISFVLPRAKSDGASAAIPASVISATKGTRIALIEPSKYSSEHTREANRRLQSAIRESSEEWFGAQVMSTQTFEDGFSEVAIFLEAPSLEYLVGNLGTQRTSDQHNLTPMIIVCQNAYDAVALRKDIEASMSAIRKIRVLSQPCGPRKLGKALEYCLLDTSPATADAPRHTGSLHGCAPISPQPYEREMPILSPHLLVPGTYSEPTTPPATLTARLELTKALQRGESQPLTPPADPGPGLSMPVEAARPMLATPAPTKVPRILLVDDNSINLQLLVTFMKKAKFPYAAASDGLEALNTYKAAASSSPSTMRPVFDYVLMDISMPVMDGLTSTREIRKFEKENKLRPAKIFALTGLASESAQKEAFESGIDHFLPKPVNFRELRALVEKIDDGQEARAVVAEVVGVK